MSFIAGSNNTKAPFDPCESHRSIQASQVHIPVVCDHHVSKAQLGWWPGPARSVSMMARGWLAAQIVRPFETEQGLAFQTFKLDKTLRLVQVGLPWLGGRVGWVILHESSLSLSLPVINGSMASIVSEEL